MTSKKSTYTSSASRQKESGAILALLAVFVGVLASMAGIAVVIGSAVAARGELDQQARAMALSAISSYFAVNGTSKDRTDNTLCRLGKVVENSPLLGQKNGEETGICYQGEDASDCSTGWSMKDEATKCTAQKQPFTLQAGQYFETEPPTNLSGLQFGATAKQLANSVCETSYLSLADLTAGGKKKDRPGAKPPCFLAASYDLLTQYSEEELDKRDLANRFSINAFKVKLNPEYSGLLGNMAGIFGASDKFKMKAEAIATVVPLWLVVIVDVSSSITSYTHVQRPIGSQLSSPVLGRGSRYAFKYSANDEDKENGGPCKLGALTYPISNRCVWDHYRNSCQWSFLNRYNFKIMDPDKPTLVSTRVNGNFYGAYCDGSGGNPPGDPIFLDPPFSIGVGNTKVHYAQDYKDATTLGDEAYDEGAAPSFLNPLYHPAPTNIADPITGSTFNTTSETYKTDSVTPPEPLSSVLSALSTAVDRFTLRHVPGDRLSIVLFDSKSAWTRTIELIDDFDYLKNLLAKSNGKSPLLDPNSPAVQLGFFPGVNGYTDLSQGLRVALERINLARQANQGTETDMNIAYIGDFIPNCVSTDSINPCAEGKCDFNGSGAFDTDDLEELKSCVEIGCKKALGKDDVCEETCPVNPYRSDNRWSEIDLYRFTKIASEQRACNNSYGYFRGARSELAKVFSEQIVPDNIKFHTLLVGPHAHTVDLCQDGKPLSDEEARKEGKDYVIGGNAKGVSFGNDEDWEEEFSKAGKETPFFEAAGSAYGFVRATGGVYQALTEIPADCQQKKSECIEDADGDGSNGNQPFRRTVDRECRSTEDQAKAFIEAIVPNEASFRVVDVK